MARPILWTVFFVVLAVAGGLFLLNRLFAPNGFYSPNGLYSPNTSVVSHATGSLARAEETPSASSHIALADAADQATRGAEVYSGHCITCHGDRGQGLTLEWRLTWDPEHQNCGRPNCHGLNHPPEGFYLPNMYAPAIVGPDTLDEFQTAQDLFDFVSTRMPFQEPGVLPQADYWALTAFLMRQNGLALPGTDLGAGTASMILLHPQLVRPTAPATPGAP